VDSAEAEEIKRMLLSFRAGLPEHDLADWRIGAKRESATVPLEGAQRVADSTAIRLTGDCKCQRCKGRFGAHEYGGDVSVTARSESDEHLAEAVEELKVRIAAQANRKPCWGDIPSLPKASMIAPC